MRQSVAEKLWRESAAACGLYYGGPVLFFHLLRRLPRSRAMVIVMDCRIHWPLARLSPWGSPDATTP